MAYLSLAIFLLFIALAWSATLIFFMARNLLAPRRMTEPRAFVRLNRTSPADLGLAFEPMGFTVRDERTKAPLRLAAWWIPTPAPSTKTAILVHGYGDAKIGGIAWAPTWQSLGWNVLAIDLRAHGESEGAQSTAGYFERDDLDQILNALQAEKPTETGSIALFGVSLGAACVAATAVRRNDIAAVVLESPFADYRRAVRIHVRRSGFPMVTATNMICSTAEWLSGCDFHAVRPMDLIPKIPCPVLAICGEADALIEPAVIAAAIHQRAADGASRCDVWPGVPHVMALAKDPERFRDQLASFLNAANANTPV